ncbi:N-acetylmuramoyl-L-alanine amidase, partial [bacterium]|nr:N-acetylmuramoyl-L-alanine amidase [candidate division CSSED10-310 bacterium]
MTRRTIPFIMLVVLCGGTALAGLSGVKIGVDPGHGGTDPGAIGPTGLYEKSVNLDTSLALRTYLQAAGASVYMTRIDDATVPLATRSSYFNSIPVDRGESVHHNASADPDPNYTGSHVYPGTCSSTSGNLAYDVAHRLDDHMGIGFVWSNCSREGVHEDNFHMVRETNMPSTLTEISFISNPAEEARLRGSSYLDANGWAIYAGINDHMGSGTPVPPTNTPTATPTSSAGDVIVDNSDAGCTFTGSAWLTGTWGDIYGADKRYSETGTGSGSATWTASLPSAGTYEV